MIPIIDVIALPIEAIDSIVPSLPFIALLRLPIDPEKSSIIPSKSFDLFCAISVIVLVSSKISFVCLTVTVKFLIKTIR